MVPLEELFGIGTSAFADQSCFAAEAEDQGFEYAAAYYVAENFAAVAEPTVVAAGQDEIAAVTSIAVAAAIVAAAAAGAGAVAHHLATKKLHSGTVAALEPWTVASHALSVDLSACHWYQIEPQ